MSTYLLVALAASLVLAILTISSSPPFQDPHDLPEPPDHAPSPPLADPAPRGSLTRSPAPIPFPSQENSPA